MAQPDTTIEVRDFGPLAHAAIDLRPLTVFVGPSNAGKTYLATLIEAHLHPSAQTRMAALLARLVRAGVRVVITTHSDWLLRELGNLLREGELARRTADTPENGGLTPGEVGVWLFRQRDSGFTVKEIPFDEIEGIEPEEYETVAERSTTDPPTCRTACRKPPPGPTPRVATDLLDSLRARIGADHLITSCGGRGCRVDMAGVPAPYVIVDADKAFPAHRLEGPRCDRVTLPARPGSPPTGQRTHRTQERRFERLPRSRPTAMQPRVRESRRAAERSARLPPNPDPRPRVHPKQRKALGRMKVRFRGQPLTIATARCNRPGNLAAALWMQPRGRHPRPAPAARA